MMQQCYIILSTYAYVYIDIHIYICIYVYIYISIHTEGVHSLSYGRHKASNMKHVDQGSQAEVALMNTQRKRGCKSKDN